MRAALVTLAATAALVVGMATGPLATPLAVSTVLDGQGFGITLTPGTETGTAIIININAHGVTFTPYAY